MANQKFSLGGLWEVLKKSFAGFGDDKVLTHAASLAYYTVFSMAPLLIVLIAFCSAFIDRAAVEGSIYTQLDGFMGSENAKGLQEIVKKAALSGDNLWATILGIVLLFMGATAVFAEIQDAVNSIWGIKAKPKRGWLKFLQNRLLSFSVIVSLGFLLLVSLAASALVDALHVRILAAYPDVAVWVLTVINQLMTFVVATGIFVVIFKVLPDAIISIRDVVVGASVTGLLFTLGKFAIGYYISTAEVGSTYGAAGSLAVLLVWTYYSAVILYFGAEFTKSFAIRFGNQIHPNDYAVTTRAIEVELGKEAVRDVETKVVDKGSVPASVTK